MNHGAWACEIGAMCLCFSVSADRCGWVSWAFGSMVCMVKDSVADSTPLSSPIFFKLRPETRGRAAVLWPCALWATPVHASSMAGSTADDHLAVDGGAMFSRRR